MKLSMLKKKFYVAFSEGFSNRHYVLFITVAVFLVMVDAIA